MKNECEICGGDHETRFCEYEICAKCEEMIDNCDCTDHDATNYEHVLTAEAWAKRNDRSQGQ